MLTAASRVFIYNTNARFIIQSFYPLNRDEEPGPSLGLQHDRHNGKNMRQSRNQTLVSLRTPNCTRALLLYGNAGANSALSLSVIAASGDGFANIPVFSEITEFVDARMRIWNLKLLSQTAIHCYR